jgi:hypothetical protein
MDEQKRPKYKVRLKPGVVKAAPAAESNNYPTKVSDKTMSGGSDGGDTAKKSTTSNASNKDITSRSSRDIGSTKPEASTNTRTMKDVQGERLDSVKPKSLPAPESSVGSKVAGGAKLLGLAKRATGIGSLLYSKDVGEGSDFKGTDKRPEAFEDIASKIPTEAPKQPATIVKKPLPIVKKAAPRESDASKDSRMAAYNDWAKTNRDPMSQLAKDRGVLTEKNTPSDSPVTMKRGGTIKKAPAKAYKSGGAVKSGASRGDGCAIRGRTKGKYC